MSHGVYKLNIDLIQSSIRSTYGVPQLRDHKNSQAIEDHNRIMMSQRKGSFHFPRLCLLSQRLLSHRSANRIEPVRARLA